MICSLIWPGDNELAGSIPSEIGKLDGLRSLMKLRKFPGRLLAWRQDFFPYSKFGFCIDMPLSGYNKLNAGDSQLGGIISPMIGNLNSLAHLNLGKLWLEDGKRDEHSFSFGKF